MACFNHRSELVRLLGILPSVSGDRYAPISDFTEDSEAERKKRDREEKRLQRQKEMQEKREARKGGGAMKLGAKKL